MQQLKSEPNDQFTDGLHRYLESRAQDIARSPGTIPADVWRDLAAMGLMGLSISEDRGGFESASHLCSAMETLGRHLVNPSGIIAGVMASRLLRTPGADAQLQERLAHGDADIAVVSGWSSDVTASPSNGGFVLKGIARHALSGERVDHVLMVCAKTAHPFSPKMLLLLRSDDLQGRTESFRLIDGSTGSLIRLDGLQVPAERVIADDIGDESDDALAWGLMCLCWEAVGAMSRLLDVTTAYAKTRRQFGVAIGSFQALQHTMVDMLLRTEVARDAALLATAQIGNEDRNAKRVALASAKFQTGRSSQFVRERAVQIHGAVGMSDEIDVTRLFRRLMVVEQTLGSSDDHIAFLAVKSFERHSSSDD